MSKKVQTFLETDLLERYLVGDTSFSESATVETYISEYPEIKAKYILLQDNLEILSKSNAIEPPTNLLENILEAVEDKPVIELHKETSKKATPWFGIAASVAALIFGAFSFFLYTQNQSLIDKNTLANDEINQLRLDAAHTNSELATVSKKYNMLINPETNKYTLRGNNRAKNLKTVAYVNPVDKLSMIDVVALPELPKEQTYQLWAEVQDKMINLGILDASKGNLMPIPYMEDAIGYSITVGPKGENHTASTENSVANISLQSNNK